MSQTLNSLSHPGACKCFFNLITWVLSRCFQSGNAFLLLISLNLEECSFIIYSVISSIWCILISHSRTSISLMLESLDLPPNVPIILVFFFFCFLFNRQFP